MIKKTNLSPVALELISAFEAAARQKKKISEKESVRVSEAMSSIAFLYEKVRNVVDYKEDHLFCISAIQRNLQRRSFLKNPQPGLAKALVREMVRSGYLKNKSVSQEEVTQVKEILKKYSGLIQALEKKGRVDRSITDWLLSIASSEIEKALVPQEEDEAMVAAFYQLLNQNIVSINNQEKAKNIQVFIAAHRTLLKSSPAKIRHHLLLGYLPGWDKADQEEIENLAGNLEKIKNQIETQLNSPQTDRIQLYLRRFTAPFLILKDILLRVPLEARSRFQNDQDLEKLIRETCEARYSETRSKLTRAATRSIIYIFLTKMLLALFLELPFDILIARHVNPVPLVINTLFPPFLMFAFVLSIQKPGEKNTQRIVKEIKEVVNEGTFKTPQYQFEPKEKSRESLRKKAFSAFYLFTFILSFGLIVWVLIKLGFNLFSIVVFLFFLTVVSFFAYRVSQTARELVIEEKESPLSAVSDFFMVPILRTGRKLSLQLSKINIFNFILDFIIEAPLKSILEIGEEWLAFIKEKKEEIV